MKIIGKNDVLIDVKVSFKKQVRDFVVRNSYIDFNCSQCFVMGGFCYPCVYFMKRKKLVCVKCLTCYFSIDTECLRNDLDVRLIC
jgi:hypothetical protein